MLVGMGMWRLATVLLICWAPAASAQEFGEVLWGFDGQARAEAFNPLSVQVSNRGGKPVSGTLVLRRTAGRSVDAPLIRSCFLSPGSSRWVQFFPWVISEAESWTLSWRDGPRGRLSLPPPPLGQPARVYLSEQLPDASARGREFPDFLFPTTVLATRGLQRLLLDSAPDWQAPRRTALLRWIHAGGQLDLLQRHGRFPEFEGDLALLNSEEASFRLGAGRVRRLEMSWDEHRKSAAGVAPRSDDEATHADAVLHAGLVKELRVEFTPRVPWSVIYGLGLVFVILIGPVYRWLGRRLLGWRAALGFLATVIVLATLAFEQLGRRSDDEQALTRSATLVRSAGPEFEIEEQHAAVFVVRGTRYQLGVRGSESLFTTAQAHEAVPGVIQNGRQGGFEVDMPLYSWRSLVRATLVPRTRRGPTLAKWPTAQEWTATEPPGIELDPGDLPRSEVAAAFYVHRDRICMLQWSEDSLVSNGRHWPILDCQRRWSQSLDQMVYYPTDSDPAPALLSKMWPLIGSDLGIRYRPDQTTTIEDRLIVYCLIERPRALDPTGHTTPQRQDGFTVHRFDLFPERR